MSGIDQQALLFVMSIDGMDAPAFARPFMSEKTRGLLTGYAFWYVKEDRDLGEGPHFSLDPHLVRLGLAMLESLDPPPSDAQETRFDEILGIAQRESERDQPVGPPDSIEAQISLLESELSVEKPLRACLTPAQTDLGKQIHLFGKDWFAFGVGSSGTSLDGAADDLIRDWRRSLQFDDRESASLKPIAVAYLAEDQSFVAERAKGLPGREVHLRRLRLLLRLQQRIKQAIPMSQAQIENLRRWTPSSEYDICGR